MNFKTKFICTFRKSTQFYLKTHQTTIRHSYFFHKNLEPYGYKYRGFQFIIFAMRNILGGFLFFVFILFIVCYQTFSYKCMFYLYIDIKLIKKY